MASATGSHDSANEAGTELKRFDAYCPRCSYNVRGNMSPAGARCPECGSILPFHHLRFTPRWHAPWSRVGGIRPSRWRYSRRIDPLRVHWSLSESLAVLLAAIAIAASTIFSSRPVRWWLFLILVPLLLLGQPIAHRLICLWRQWQLEHYERWRLQARLGRDWEAAVDRHRDRRGGR